MARSRGGLTTKIHAVVDANGRPISLDLTAGQAHDNRMAEPMLQDMREGAILLADRAYDTNALRDLAKEKRAWANIPAKRNRKARFPFSEWVYRQRNLIERFFNKLKQFRGIATRYDKDPRNFLAAIKLVATRIWISSAFETIQRATRGSAKSASSYGPSESQRHKLVTRRLYRARSASHFMSR